MIDLIDIKKSFNGRRVLCGVDLKIKQGEITVIIGRSGEGKSVLIKHIIGLLKPDSGRILLEGKDLVTMKTREFSEVLKRFGMLFQGGALFDSMTVAGNVGFALAEHTGLSQKAIREVTLRKLNMVGLRGVEDMMPSELSGGMKKRVGLARAIAMDPEIVIFDEPTTGLDPVTSDAIANLILETQRQLKTTYIVITHDIKLTYKIADMIAMLHKGIIIEHGSVDYMQKSEDPILSQFLEGRAEGPLTIY
ncbi:Phospholipid ABC transporter ATP-binding protein MlaF [hydrothermal vent metagenome]|uniref:Phospholipid ABC transporter ATP-binding protein MlaF n=1 Tax=hydrothermal vent metagenome TaxID=652676 RepID=A0A3B0VCG2_9ZZZZ